MRYTKVPKSSTDELLKITTRVQKSMKVEEFGLNLLKTLDLDPVYIALVGSGLADSVLKRWLVSYWCFYSTGAASYMCQFEDHDFWNVFKQAVLNVDESPLGARWPRGAERRHYRGQQAIDSYSYLVETFPQPEQLVDYVVGPGPEFTSNWKPAGGPNRAVKDVMDRAQTVVGFGPWISFKIADMIDRVLGQPVDFEDGVIFMFQDPALAADRVWEIAWGNAPQRNQRKIVCDVLKACYKDIKAPPLFERSVNIQEVETILCKWKSHTNGHYPLGKDTREVIHSLVEWETVAPVAANLRLALEKATQHA